MGFFKRLFGGRARDDGGVSDAIEQETNAALDAAIARLREGEGLPAEALEQLAALYARLYDALCKRNGTEDNTSFAKDDSARLYLSAIKLSALGHPHHDAWPVMSGMRFRISEAIETRTRTAPTPWLYLAGIMPALMEERFERAFACYQQLGSDPFLKGLAHRFVNEAQMAYPAYNRSDALETFSHAMTKQTPWLTPTLPADRAWILQAMVHPFLSVDARTELADARFVGASALRLSLDWDVTDYESAVKTLVWLETRGHRATLMADLDAPEKIASRARAKLVKENREALEATSFLAWDLCRAISVARLSYAAGYLTDEETWDHLLAVGEALARTYPSWERLGEDYILGCRYFAPDEKDSAHVAMTRWLMTSYASPWRQYTIGG